MRYTIVKFEGDYGPPIYRIRLHRLLWARWLKDSGGAVLSFDTKAQAHAHMRAQCAEQAEGRSAGESDLAKKAPRFGCLTRTRT